MTLAQKKSWTSWGQPMAHGNCPEKLFASCFRASFDQFFFFVFYKSYPSSDPCRRIVASKSQNGRDALKRTQDNDLIIDLWLASYIVLGFDYFCLIYFVLSQQFVITSIRAWGWAIWRQMWRFMSVFSAISLWNWPHRIKISGNTFDVFSKQ